MNNQEANLALFAMGQDGQDDEKPLPNVPDPFAKFVETAELAAACGRHGHTLAENFAASTQDIDARARDIYKTLAAKAQAAPLAKSAATSDWDAPLEKGERIERTRIGDSVICAVMDSRGVCIRTYKES